MNYIERGSNKEVLTDICCESPTTYDLTLTRTSHPLSWTNTASFYLQSAVSANGQSTKYNNEQQCIPSVKYSTFLYFDFFKLYFDIIFYTCLYFE